MSAQVDALVDLAQSNKGISLMLVVVIALLLSERFREKFIQVFQASGDRGDLAQDWRMGSKPKQSAISHDYAMQKELGIRGSGQLISHGTDRSGQFYAAKDLAAVVGGTTTSVSDRLFQPSTYSDGLPLGQLPHSEVGFQISPESVVGLGAQVGKHQMESRSGASWRQDHGGKTDKFAEIIPCRNKIGSSSQCGAVDSMRPEHYQNFPTLYKSPIGAGFAFGATSGASRKIAGITQLSNLRQ